ncbi:hypothetical protein KQI84_15115 [bacterium]|nr:hypothetical protein [bacterium]
MTLRPDIAATLMRLHRNDRSRGAAGSLLEQQTRAMAGVFGIRAFELGASAKEGRKTFEAYLREPVLMTITEESSPLLMGLLGIGQVAFPVSFGSIPAVPKEDIQASQCRLLYPHLPQQIEFLASPSLLNREPGQPWKEEWRQGSDTIGYPAEFPRELVPGLRRLIEFGEVDPDEGALFQSLFDTSQLLEALCDGGTLSQGIFAFLLEAASTCAAFGSPDLGAVLFRLLHVIDCLGEGQKNNLVDAVLEWLPALQRVPELRFGYEILGRAASERQVLHIIRPSLEGDPVRRAFAVHGLAAFVLRQPRSDWRRKASERILEHLDDDSPLVSLMAELAIRRFRVEDPREILDLLVDPAPPHTEKYKPQPRREVPHLPSYRRQLRKWPEKQCSLIQAGVRERFFFSRALIQTRASELIRPEAPGILESAPKHDRRRIVNGFLKTLMPLCGQAIDSEPVCFFTERLAWQKLFVDGLWSEALTSEAIARQLLQPVADPSPPRTEPIESSYFFHPRFRYDEHGRFLTLLLLSHHEQPDCLYDPEGISRAALQGMIDLAESPEWPGGIFDGLFVKLLMGLSIGMSTEEFDLVCGYVFDRLEKKRDPASLYWAAELLGWNSPFPQTLDMLEAGEGDDEQLQAFVVQFCGRAAFMGDDEAFRHRALDRLRHGKRSKSDLVWSKAVEALRFLGM